MAQGVSLAVSDQPSDLDRRVKLAASPASPPALLAGLATDGAVTVRAALALNPAVPHESQRELARDADERVRLLLARKLTTALPGLCAPSQAVLRDRTLDVLSELVRDEATRIRAAIAADLAAMPDVPHALMLALAQDAAICVSEPVLRLSPLLTAEDLLALLATPPHERTATAIACRAHLPETVADAIAATADSPAVAALLGNPSAAIRESTLDALIARASGEPGWQAPLVRRPRLPDQAARALAEIVTGHLLDELAARPDLPGDLVAALRQRFVPGAVAAARLAAEGDVELMVEIRALDKRGAVNEASLVASLRAGEDRRAMAMLAVAAAVPLGIVQRAAALRSAKGLVSLVWKAGFSVRATGPVQTAIGRIAPAAMLVAARPNEFPLQADEMGWQLEFLAGKRR